MNIKLAIFNARFNGKFMVGAHFESPITEGNHFYGFVGDNLEQLLIELINTIDDESEELGHIEFISKSTDYFNFLCKGQSKDNAPACDSLRATLTKLNASKGTKFKKNETPTEGDVISLSRADMMVAQIKRKYEMDGSLTLSYVDNKNLTLLKKGAKQVPDIFLGPKIFTWGETKSVDIDGESMELYYNGAYTTKTDSMKKNNNLAEVDKLLNRRLYTYYTGSNTKLTDAGQRSLDEVRCITLVKEKHPIIEKYIELQQTTIDDLPTTPVVVGNIDKIVGTASSNRFMLEDNYWFSFNEDSRDLIFNGITRADISHVFFPQRLGPRIRNEFIALETMFLGHLRGTKISDEYDITHLMYKYEPNAKGKVVCSGLDVLGGKFNFIKIPGVEYGGRKFTIKYVFGIDSPVARALKKLEKLNPKVSLVFKTTSDTTYTYYTIIRTDIGVSIYHCPEGSKLIRRRGK